MEFEFEFLVLLIAGVLPSGVIRVRIRGRLRLFLVRAIHWAPSITVIDADGATYILPSANYPPATPGEAARFWSQLEQAIYDKFTDSRN